MSNIGQEFIARSRFHLTQDYLPKIERCLDLLSDEQIWWRANAQSNSIGNLLLHLSGNVRQWIVTGLGSAADTRDRDAEFAQRDVISREELLARLRQTLQEADGVLANFNTDNLLKEYRIQEFDVSALEATLHVVEHFSMHTGQIIMLTKFFTEIDLEFYDFFGPTPVLTWKRDP
jgi:uncharacterized damage-inducible protein DinB